MEAVGGLAPPTETVEFRTMSKRAFILASVLLPILLSPGWAQDTPVATAPIPPAVKAAPDTPLVVPTRPHLTPAAPAKTATPPANAAARPSQPSPASAAKPVARVKEAEQKKAKPPADRPPQTAAKTAEKKPEKPEMKAEAKAGARTRVAALPSRVVTRRRWVARSEPRWVERRWVERAEPRWVPPPPPWYERQERGPMAYGPYGGGMRVPPPWDD
jgi:hypothetical protein